MIKLVLLDMNMLLHNIKVALRNLLKYKVQTLMSILSLSIGMVTLSVVHSLMLNFRPSAITHEPYYERACVIEYDSIRGGQSDERIHLNGDIVRALKANGGLRSIEQGPYAPNGYTLGGWAEFTLNNGARRKMQMDVTPIDGNYLNYAGIHSAITGEKIKVLKKNEAVIGISSAKKIFGKLNPVGSRLFLRKGDRSYQLTVVDVYDDFSHSERVLLNGNLYYSPCNLEDMYFDDEYYAVWLDVVLKDHATMKQLEAEVNDRLKPLGLKATVKSLKDSLSGENKVIEMTITLSYLIGSLVLIAAIIGFLRMQTQLFWMRRREISLRITNGATRWQLFGMFATESICIILTACVVAVLMCDWVVGFMANKLSEFADDLGSMSNLYQYSLGIGIVVLLLCLGIVWVVLRRICNSQSLEMGMRKGHSHWFRNLMLGVQVVISMFFLASTFDFVQLADKLAEFNHIPKDERAYESSFYMNTHEADDCKRLRSYLLKLPEVEEYIPYEHGFYRFDELSENEDFVKSLNDSMGKYKNYNYVPINFYTIITSDTSWLDYFHVKVNWKPRAKRVRGVLVNEKMYKKMRQQNVSPNDMLTFEGEVYPIEGTFEKFAYLPDDWNGKSSIIVIAPKMKDECEDYILVPKSGEYAALKTSVQKTIEELEPAVVKPMMLNLRDYLARNMLLVEALRGMAGILAGISLAICLMSIFSTVMLDARTRKKEIAIRKVNGALGRDIAKLFAKTYVVIVGLAIVFAVVSALLFHVVLNMMAGDLQLEISAVAPILLGVGVVVIFIAVIIVWQIRSIMRIDPSEILAKE